MRSPITTIDLFAGAGGLTTGFHLSSPRFVPIVAVEHDRTAAATFGINYPEAQVVNGPIQDWVLERDIPGADVIIGGPPCQGFSALGKQDVNDERNDLWEQYAEVILEAKPKYFIVENVAQFLTSTQFKEFEKRTLGGGTLADYDISTRGVLNAAEFGAAQTRRRTVIIGRHRDMPEIALPEPTHLHPANWRTVKDAWEGVEPRVVNTQLPERWTEQGSKRMAGHFATWELHLTRNYAAVSKARFPYIPYGGNRYDIPLSLQPNCWRGHRTGSGDVMGRLRWEKPSVTIRTEFVKPEKGRYLHPVENRSITLMEGALLQGFPREYQWFGSKSDIAKQIGNAVPIELAAALGSQIEALL